MLCWFVTTTTTSAATTLPVSLRRAREDLIRAPFPSDLVRRIRLRIKRTDGRPDVGYWEAACSSGSRVSTQMSVGAATVGTDQSRCRAHIDRASAPANAHNPPFIPLHARVLCPELSAGSRSSSSNDQQSGYSSESRRPPVVPEVAVTHRGRAVKEKTNEN